MSEDVAKKEQFMLLAKHAKGLALVDLITKATAEPGLFTFGELLSLPGVQELRGGQHNAAYELLHLFTYGTWQQYTDAPPGKYPALTEAQAHKLRLLSVVSAADGVRTLAYDDLLAALQLPSVRALEDLLIAHCLYGGLLRGKLDQRNKCFHVEEAFCRDVPPEQLGGVAEALGDWLASAQAVLATIEQRVEWTQKATEAAERARSEAAAALESERKSIRTTVELQAAADSTGMLMDEEVGFTLADVEQVQDARPASAGRHTKRRR